jgi:hypothetical protein
MTSGGFHLKHHFFNRHRVYLCSNVTPTIDIGWLSFKTSILQSISGGFLLGHHSCNKYVVYFCSNITPGIDIRWISLEPLLPPSSGGFLLYVTPAVDMLMISVEPGRYNTDARDSFNAHTNGQTNLWSQPPIKLI